MNELSFLLPHSYDIVLIDEILSYTSTSIVCKAVIKDDLRFLENGKFYAYKCIEIMAQSLGMLSSLVSSDRKASIGFLLGSRMFDIYKNYFDIGDELIIKSEVSSCDKFGFGVYESSVFFKNELSIFAKLSVINPSAEQLKEMIGG